MSCYLTLHDWVDTRWSVDHCDRCGFSWPSRYRSIRPILGEGRPMVRAIAAGLTFGLGAFTILTGALELLGLVYMAAGAWQLWHSLQLARAHELRLEVTDPKSVR